MSTIEERIEQMGFSLPSAPTPVANYVTPVLPFNIPVEIEMIVEVE